MDILQCTFFLPRVPCYAKVCIGCRSVYRHFSDPESDSKRNRTGIQLLGIVLANGLPPYNTAAVRGVSEERWVGETLFVGG